MLISTSNATYRILHAFFWEIGLHVQYLASVVSVLDAGISHPLTIPHRESVPSDPSTELSRLHIQVSHHIIFEFPFIACSSIESCIPHFSTFITITTTWHGGTSLQPPAHTPAFSLCTPVPPDRSDATLPCFIFSRPGFASPDNKFI